MRVALFTDTFPPQVNGVAHTVLRLAQGLAAAEHEVRVFTVSAAPQEKLNAIGGNVFTVRSLPSLPALVYAGERFGVPSRQALAAVREFAPDIIHTHTPFSVGFTAVHCARKLGVPLIGTHHTFFDHYLKYVHLDFDLMRWVSWKLTVWYYNRCDLVLSPTRSLADSLQKNGLYKSMTLVPNILDTNFYSPPLVKQSDGKTLVYLGRLSYEKSIDGVLDAFAVLVKTVPDVHLLLIGDGPERTHLEARAKLLGLGSQVCFTGFLHDQELVEELRLGDVYVSASKSENMPLAVMEALAVGLPVVAVGSLGMRELVVDGDNGYLTLPDAPEELASRAAEVLQDTPLRERLARGARASALAYSQEQIIARTVELYEAIRRKEPIPTEYVSTRNDMADRATSHTQN